MPDPEIKILIDLVKCFGVDAFGEVGVLLGPVFKDGLEARTDSNGLFKEFLTFLVEKEFETVSDKHEIEDKVLVFWVIAGDANNIPNML